MENNNEQQFKYESVAQLKTLLTKQAKSWIFEETEEGNTSFAQFYFIGTHEGKEVIFNAVLSQLELHFHGLLSDMAEEKLLSLYPKYKGLYADVQEEMSEEMSEEIEEKRNELMKQLEHETKVTEFVEVTVENPVNISLYACLNLPEITPKSIDNFVKHYVEKTFKADETAYSFSLDKMIRDAASDLGLFDEK